VFASGTYMWSDIVRMDVVAAPPSTWLAFYSPGTLRVHAQPLTKVCGEEERTGHPSLLCFTRGLNKM